jgi:hypothetical protein
MNFLNKRSTAKCSKSFYKILCNVWITIILYCSGNANQFLASTGEAMSNSSPERNKAIVLEAFETLFNKRDYVAAERFWSPNYMPAQRPYTTRARRTVQSRPLGAGDVALRKPTHHRRRRLRHSAWPLYGDGTARRLVIRLSGRNSIDGYVGNTCPDANASPGDVITLS